MRDWNLGLLWSPEITADYSPVVLQLLINQDVERLSSWFVSNYLQANEDMTQAACHAEESIY